VARRIFDFDRPDRFVTGTIGEPGRRTFFLQAIQDGRLTSVALEKVQVALLADRVVALLAEVARRGLVAVRPDDIEGDDERPLDEPLREEFRVGAMTIAWDAAAGRLILEARSATEDEDDQDEDDQDEEIPDDSPVGPDILRVRLSAAMARGFARRAARVVAAGRPPCPFCGQPLEPTGHLCPRRNGSGYVH
jgi:uncharacterized repeat protein (TIGR03847 family)